MKTWLGRQVFIMVACLLLSCPVRCLANPSDSLALSTNSSSANVGGVIDLSVTETGSASFEAAVATFDYPASMLQYLSTSINSDFGSNGQSSGGDGQVSIRVSSSQPVSGNELIATTTFRILAAGQISFNLADGSALVDSSGNSVWDGIFTSVTLTAIVLPSNTNVNPGGPTSYTTIPSTVGTSSKPNTPGQTNSTVQLRSGKKLNTKKASGSVWLLGTVMLLIGLSYLFLRKTGWVTFITSRKKLYRFKVAKTASKKEITRQKPAQLVAPKKPAAKIVQSPNSTSSGPKPKPKPRLIQL